ncbi:hypothetical protein JCM8547_003679 [Rhodosporidiobolus lusitaniae]
MRIHTYPPAASAPSRTPGTPVSSLSSASPHPSLGLSALASNSPPSASSSAKHSPFPLSSTSTTTTSTSMAHHEEHDKPVGTAAGGRKGGPVIWGFDLSEMSFHAFKTKELMDPRWHLRKERVIAYQVAMLVCLAAECCATYSLSKYEDLQGHIETRFPPAHVYQNDIIDLEIVTIVMCVMVACLYGADFFFLVQFPKRTYPAWYQKTKKAAAVTVTSGVLAAAVGLTVVVARNSAQIQHVSQDIADAAAAYYFRPPLRYRDWAVNIAALCLLWPGWVACVVATIFMFMAADYDALHGTAPSSSLGASSPSISGVPLASTGLPSSTPTAGNPFASDSAASLPAGAYRENAGTAAEKVVLPTPEGRRLSIERPGEDGRLNVETDHATFEGQGRAGVLGEGYGHGARDAGRMV